jgi:hypothetical protein
LAQNEVFLRSNKIISVCKEHGNTTPVVELNYTEYPFEITIRSLASVANILSEEKLRDYREVFENSVANTEGINVVIIVRYPTGQSSRMMGSMVFTRPDNLLDAPNPDLDRSGASLMDVV